jgi:hypothetical protein
MKMGIGVRLTRELMEERSNSGGQGRRVLQRIAAPGSLLEKHDRLPQPSQNGAAPNEAAVCFLSL